MGFGGSALTETAIKSGLQDLNPDIEFDRVTKWGQWHPYQSTRQGVWYNGTHICSMDRGVIPELKTWDLEDGIIEMDPVDIDRYDDVMCAYVEIIPSDPFYNEALSRSQAKDDRFTYEENTGKVFRWTHFRFGKVRGRLCRVGWRHTFERLIAANVPGITRDAIGLKFGVDMYKYPIGPPEDVMAALVEE